jgi:hypothetical protein
MTSKYSIAALLACSLGVAAPLQAAGSDPYRVDLMGTMATPQAAQRSITIGPGTRHVNVVRNEVIRFNVGDKSFTWLFDGPLQVTSIELERVAPPGMLDHRVTAYVSPDPLRDTHW